MRIAIWHNLPSGGGKRALSDQVRGLRERGHHIEVWCPPTADRAFLPLPADVPEHVVPLPFDMVNAGGRLARLRFAQARIAAMDRHCAECAREIERGGFDLLLAHPCTYFRVTSIGRQTDLPSVVYVQEPYRWLYEALPRLPWLALPPMPGAGPVHRAKEGLRDYLKTRGLRVQAREEVANAAAFDERLVNSCFSRESLLRAYGLDSRVCYLGVDTEHFVDRGLPREPFVASVGALVPEKRPDLIIEAVGTIAKPRPRLVWVGNVAIPEYLDELRALAAARGVHFETHVRVPEETVLDLLNRAAVMAFAPQLEPFGYAPLEANACGAPVVAIAEGGVRETVTDGVNGLLVERSPEALGMAITRLLEDPALAARLGRQGAEIARERWSLRAAADNLEARLKAVAARRVETTS